MVNVNLDPAFVQYVNRRLTVGHLVVVAAIVFSFINTATSIALYALLTPLYIFAMYLDPSLDRGAKNRRR